MTTTLEIAPAAPSAAELGPVRPSERIAEMDILRGFALLGILVVNLFVFYTPLSLRGSRAVDLYPGGLDKAVLWIHELPRLGEVRRDVLVPLRRRLRDPDGPGRGQGGAVRRDVPATHGHAARLRPGPRGLPVGRRHPARLRRNRTGPDPRPEAPGPLALGDRRLLRLLPPGRTLVTIARHEKPPHTAAQRLERGLDQLRIYGRGEYVLPRIDKDKATGALKPPLRVTGSGTYPQMVADRISDLIFQYRYGTYAWFWPLMGTTLVIGFIAGRRRFFQDIPGHLPLIRTITWWSGGIGLALAAAFASGRLLATRGGDWSNALRMVIWVLYIVNGPIVCAFYMGAIVLLAQRPAWRAAMSPLASVGRMPLTNYLMQSVIASTLFYGYGFGLYYRIGPAVGVLIAFAIYAVQVAYSAWWMARFRFGPMEWLWRTLTYGNAPAMLAPAGPPLAGIPVKMTKGLPSSAPADDIVEDLGLPAEPAGNFAAMINWGEGTRPTTGTVAAMP